jgi:hypothetical protein
MGNTGYNPIRRAMILATIAVCLSTVACRGTRLEEYQARNPDERAIIATLARYEAAKNRFDVAGYMAVLHPEGLYMLGDSLVSKQRLARLLPEFWEKLHGHDHPFFPITREGVNGDYFESGLFTNPRTRIAGDTAEAILIFSKGFWHLDYLVSMRREAGKWWIDRLDWVQN